MSVLLFRIFLPERLLLKNFVQNWRTGSAVRCYNLTPPGMGNYVSAARAPGVDPQTVTPIRGSQYCLLCPSKGKDNTNVFVGLQFYSSVAQTPPETPTDGIFSFDQCTHTVHNNSSGKRSEPRVF